jgi:hypothetical protein
MKIKNVLFIFIILCTIGITWYFHNRHQVELARKEQEINRENATIKQKNNQYIKEMTPMCQKPTNELTGVDVYRCKRILDIGNGTFDVTYELFDMRQELANPDLPTFCQKKVKELTTEQVASCIIDPTSSPEPIDNEN